MRFGGGLRVYLERPWFSSGVDELLGVVLWNYSHVAFDREQWKPYITQWGADPIWKSKTLPRVPSSWNFPGAIASEYNLSVGQVLPEYVGKPGKVAVVGFPVHFDESRDLWYCDLNVDVDTYSPFIRLALARYQPYALLDAKLSRVVLADFSQLTPDRAVMVTADPYRPRQLRVTVSGSAPQGPLPINTAEPPAQSKPARATEVRVRVQRRLPVVESDMLWREVPEGAAKVTRDYEGPAIDETGLLLDLALWTGRVEFTQAPQPGQYRLLIEEFEYIDADYTVQEEVQRQRSRRVFPGRLIFAETVELDAALLSRPAPGSAGRSCRKDRMRGIGLQDI